MTGGVRISLSQGRDAWLVIHYKIVSPEIINTNAILNGYNRFNVYIYSDMSIQRKGGNQFKRSWKSMGQFGKRKRQDVI